MHGGSHAQRLLKISPGSAGIKNRSLSINQSIGIGAILDHTPETLFAKIKLLFTPLPLRNIADHDLVAMIAKHSDDDFHGHSGAIFAGKRYLRERCFSCFKISYRYFLKQLL